MHAYTEHDGAGTGFRMKPTGPSVLRDYGSEDPAALAALRALLDEVLTRHKLLIPGQLNRFVHQWRADVQRGIDANDNRLDNADHATGDASVTTGDASVNGDIANDMTDRSLRNAREHRDDMARWLALELLLTDEMAREDEVLQEHLIALQDKIEAKARSAA